MPVAYALLLMIHKRGSSEWQFERSCVIDWMPLCFVLGLKVSKIKLRTKRHAPARLKCVMWRDTVVNDGVSCTYSEGIITLEVYCRGNLTKGRKLRGGEKVKKSETASHHHTFSTSTDLLR